MKSTTARTGSSALAAILTLLALATAPLASAQADLPAAPAIDSITAGERWLGMAWSAPSNDGGSTVIAYDIRRIESDSADKSDGNWAVVEDVWVTGGGNLLHILTGLEPGERYDLQVRAVNTSGAGAWSSTAQATPADAPSSSGRATTLPLRTTSNGDLHPLGDNRYPGSFHSGNDIDYYKIVVSQAQARNSTGYWFASQGDTDTQATLSASNGQVLAVSGSLDSSPHPEHFFIYGELGADTYYLRVESSSNTQGSYEIQVRTFPETSSRSNAIELPLGGVAAGNLFEPGDEDFYKLFLPSRTDLILRSDGLADTTGELQHRNGAGLANNDDGLFPQDPYQFLIRRTLESGTYYLKVAGYANQATGPYRVRAVATGSPGNTWVTAQPLTLGDAAGGNISSTGDTDYFHMAVDEDTYVTLWAVHNGDHIDADAELLDGARRTLTADYLHDFAGTVGFGMEHRFAAGTHFLKVTGDDSSGKYTLLATENVRFEQVARACSGLPRIPGIDDRLFGCQWHLNNDGQLGSGAKKDIVVEPVWRAGNLGAGATVAIVDAGFNHRHPDLIDNVVTGRNHDYRGTGEIYDYRYNHGTAVAGIAAARDNRIGMRGVAPRASIYGYNVLNSGNTTLNAQQRDEADAMNRNAAATAVSNNSWGPLDTSVREPAHSFWESAVESGLATGYGGKGTFFAWAAGNGAPRGDYSNLDEYANFYGVTAVCAVNHRDKRASYSETGSNLWVCAPSGNDATGPRIATTWNQGRFIDSFDGTSAATPQVSGLAALLRNTNPNLTWRDIKLILAASARKNDPSDFGWREGAIKYGSSTERYAFNHQYGFGVIDAEAAVDLAAGWNIVPPLRMTTGSSGEIEGSIPDASFDGTPGKQIGHSINLDDSVEFIEFVTLRTRFEHPSFRDLHVDLVSPSGTVSTLAPFYDLSNGPDIPLDALDTEFRLSSARHLGEPSQGTWKIQVRDHHAFDAGRLASWSITAYGHAIGPAAPVLHAPVQHPTGGLIVTWDAPGDTGVSAVASYDLRYIRSDATDKDADGNWTERTGIWNSGDLTYRLEGLEAHTGYDVQVRAVNADRNGKWSATQAATTGENIPDLAPGCPAPDLANREQVWQGTLTVGEAVTETGQRIGWGYDPLVGSLTETKTPFVIGGKKYRVGDLVIQYERDPALPPVYVPPTGALVVNFKRNLPPSERQDLVLHVCSEPFSFSDAERPPGYDENPSPKNNSQWHDFYWKDSGLEWSEGLVRVLTLSLPELP